MDVATASLVFAIALGAAATAVAALLARAITSVPTEDRSYLDRPPLAFRLLWWPIQVLAFYLGPLLPVRWRQAVTVRLRTAGLDYALSPAQFIAARLLAAALAAALGYWLAGSFGQPRALPALGAAAFAYLYPAIWLKDRIGARRHLLLKQLPFFLDVITLCVEAGLNLIGALEQSMRKGPAGPLRDEFARILRDIRAGRPRADALRAFAERLNEPAVANLVAAVIQAENMGMSLGPILRAQADQRRTERFARAEKLAMEAPVKMLFPLIAFIFPCTFVVIGFPIAMKFLQSGF